MKYIKTFENKKLKFKVGDKVSYEIYDDYIIKKAGNLKHPKNYDYIIIDNDKTHKHFAYENELTLIPEYKINANKYNL